MGGQSQQTQDTSNNSTNQANTDQTSMTQALQQGNTSTLQNQLQQTNQNQNTNQVQGNNQFQSAQSGPWSAALPTVQGLLGQLNPLIANSGTTPGMTDAFNQLQSNYSQGNPYAAQIGGITSNMLSGGGATGQNGNISGALDAYKAQLNPYANGSMVGNNTALRDQLATIQNDVGNSINSQFAAAGRDLSGANQQAYGRGVAQGQAPVIAAQYNQDVQNQLGAAGNLYNAGNTTAGLLNGTNQQFLSNQQAGIGNVGSALDANNYGANKSLELEQLKQQLPTQNLGLLTQLGTSLAGLGNTSTSMNNGVSTNTGNVTGNTTNTGITSGNTNTTQLNQTLQEALSNLYGSSSSTGKMTGTGQMSGAQQFGTIASGIGSLFGRR